MEVWWWDESVQLGPGCFRSAHAVRDEGNTLRLDDDYGVPWYVKRWDVRGERGYHTGAVARDGTRVYYRDLASCVRAVAARARDVEASARETLVFAEAALAALETT